MSANLLRATQTGASAITTIYDDNTAQDTALRPHFTLNRGRDVYDSWRPMVQA